MKKLTGIALVALSFILSSCATPPPPNPDDTLVYMIIDTAEMAGSFHWAAFMSTDKVKKSGVVWDYAPDGQKRHVVAWVTLTKAKSFYLEEFQAIHDGFLASGKTEIYQIPLQQSPIHVERSSGPASIKYVGAIKVHYIRTGAFKANQFSMEKCMDCPGEKAALVGMQKIMQKYPTGVLAATNNYKELIDARASKLQ